MKKCKLMTAQRLYVVETALPWTALIIDGRKVPHGPGGMAGFLPVFTSKKAANRAAKQSGARVSVWNYNAKLKGGAE